MRAVVLAESGLRVQDVPLPVVKSGEVLLKVLRAGLCETDLQLVRGYMGFRGVLGHEFVGIPESGRFRGQRVVGEINCACHNCPTCDSGLPTHCPRRSVLGILNHDGAFAEYIAVPEVNLHPVPDHVTEEQAVFVEPLAAAFQILEQIPVLAGRVVVVLGDGRLGQLCARVLALAGCRLTVLGKHLSKLSRLQGLAIETALVQDWTSERYADVVVDCTGSSTGLATALQLLKPRGTLVLKTTVAGTPPLTLAPIVIDEIQVIGSRCGPFPPALAALASGAIDVMPLIDGRFRLDQALAAFELAQTQPVMKLLLDPCEH